MTTLNLSSNDFQINGQSFRFPIKIERLKSVLGNFNKQKKEKYNTIYTCNEFGILAYSKEGKIVESLVLYLTQKDFDFSPKQVFQGQFIFNSKDIVTYYKENKSERIKLFDGDKTGALVSNGVCAWFHCDSFNTKIIKTIEIRAFEGSTKTEVPKDKYLIKALTEEQIEFEDFGFKLAIIQELMYTKNLIKPKFDLHEFVEWYDKKKIDLDEEGYEPISEVTQYFKELPIPKNLAKEITEIYQDGGNDIYLNLLCFGEGWEDFWDIEITTDANKFPNLKKAILCHAKENVIDELNEMGIKTKWL
jgi:hypothetical protein